MAILQSIDYSRFEIFSNVADEISTKVLSSILDCEIPDRHDFEFSIKATEKKIPERGPSSYVGN